MTEFPTIKVVAQNRRALLKSVSRGGVAAELGTFAGRFARDILAITAPKHLYVVDLFRGTVVSGDENGENIMALDMEAMRQHLESSFLTAPVSVVTADSVSWLSKQEPHSLDWVYIDTTHTADQTWHELCAAAQAVKRGGLIMGHDYDKQYGVPQSVDTFAITNGFDLEIWSGDKLASYKIVNGSV